MLLFQCFYFNVYFSMFIFQCMYINAICHAIYQYLYMDNRFNIAMLTPSAISDFLKLKAPTMSGLRF